MELRALFLTSSSSILSISFFKLTYRIKKDTADNNEQPWLKVQRTFLNKWIDTSLKIELKEERAKSVQKQNEMLSVKN